MKHLLLLLTCALTAATAAAQTRPIYKCGGGTYSEVPCADGKVLEATDPRSAAQRAEARRLQQRQREQAAKEAREKAAAEKAARAASGAGKP